MAESTNKRTLCLDDEPYNENKFKHQPPAVDQVIPPANSIERPGVDKLVEEACSTAPPLEDGDTFGTNVVGEQLHQESYARSS